MPADAELRGHGRDAVAVAANAQANHFLAALGQRRA
jgi:hypothetical protein